MMFNMPASSWKQPIHILAFGFGSGASPYAPGTAGTLMAVPFFLLTRALKYKLTRNPGIRNLF